MLSTNHQLSASAWDILRALSIQVTYLTLDQIAAAWCSSAPEPLAQAGEIADRLAHEGLVEQKVIEVYPMDGVRRPVWQWSPEDPPPTAKEFERVSAILNSRWLNELVSVTVIVAGHEALNAFGSSRGKIEERTSDWSHDLLISDVFLHYRKHEPDRVADWYGEAFVPKLGKRIKGMKDPDAFLLVDRRIRRVIEIGGKYSVAHLQALHQHCDGGAYSRLREYVENQQGQCSLELYDHVRIAYEIW